MSDNVANAKAKKVARTRALARAAHTHADMVLRRDNAHADLVSAGEGDRRPMMGGCNVDIWVTI